MPPSTLRTQRRPATLVVLVLLPGCGAGVAAVVASSGSSGGSTTPALSAFAVMLVSKRVAGVAALDAGPAAADVIEPVASSLAGTAAAARGGLALGETMT